MAPGPGPYCPYSTRKLDGVGRRGGGAGEVPPAGETYHVALLPYGSTQRETTPIGTDYNYCTNNHYVAYLTIK